MPQIKKLRSLNPLFLAKELNFSELNEKLKEELAINEVLKSDLLQAQVAYQNIQIQENFVDFELEAVQHYDFIAKEKLANQINKVRIQNINIQREIEKIQKEIKDKEKAAKRKVSEMSDKEFEKHYEKVLIQLEELNNMDKNYAIRWLWDHGYQIGNDEYYNDFLDNNLENITWDNIKEKEQEIKEQYEREREEFDNQFNSLQMFDDLLDLN